MLEATLKLFADPTRLRMLALLEREEVSVGELSRALGISQSRVSNHLRLLREADLLQERHEGPSTFLRWRGAQGAPTNLGVRLWKSLREELDGLPEHVADLRRLEQVLSQRSSGERDFFDRMADNWDKIAGAFQTGQARQRAALHLFPRGLTVADLGCGTGYMSSSLVGLCDRLICVDRSEGMLEEAKKRLSGTTHRTQVEFRPGRLDQLPIEDGELDGLVCGMVLHHLEEPGPALAEMLRVLKPGGAVSILELAPHREEWMRSALGDRHLGIASNDILAALDRHGFTDLSLDPVEDRYRPRRPDADSASEPSSLSLYLVRGRAPSDPHS